VSMPHFSMIASLNLSRLPLFSVTQSVSPDSLSYIFRRGCAAMVFTNEQNLDLQRDALIRTGCSEKNIFTDKITGTKAERMGLEQALSHLREGDTFVVWRLDRGAAAR
jgi:hypothetical protein